MITNKSEFFPQWFSGLFALCGTFYIARMGRTSSDRIRYAGGAFILTHADREDVLDIVMREVGGRIEPYKTAGARTCWRTKTVTELEYVCELLSYADECPLPKTLARQHELMERFLATRLPKGKPKEKDLEKLELILEERGQIYEEIQMAKGRR